MLRPVLISQLGRRYFPESLDCFTGIRTQRTEEKYFTENYSTVIIGKPSGNIYFVDTEERLENLLQNLSEIEGEILFQTSLAIRP